MLEQRRAVQGGRRPGAEVAQLLAGDRVGRIEGGVLERDARGIVELVVEDQVVVEGGVGVVVERHPRGLGADAVQVRAAGVVLDIAVAPLGDGGHPDREGVADGDVHHGFQQAVVGTAALAVDRPVQAVLIGLVVDDVDRPCQGGAAVEGGLGALGHLDALQVEQLDRGGGHLRDIDAVLVDRDARLVGGIGRVGGHPAHDDAGVVDRLVLNVEAGGVQRQVVQVLDAARLHLGAGQGGDGDRHVDQLLLAVLGGDDHLLHGGRCGTGVLGEG